MGAGERVMLIGNTREPYLCVKKDEKAFMSFWAKHIFLPPPDYSSRKLIWPGLFERHGGRMNHEFDLSTLAHISEGYTSGRLDMVVHSLLTKRRLERLRQQPVDIPEILQWLCKVRWVQVTCFWCARCCQFNTMKPGSTLGTSPALVAR